MTNPCDLIYIFDSRLEKREQGLGLTLSGKCKVIYDYKKNKLDISLNHQYVDDFWGDTVDNCFAIVGENGAGKTVLMNLIMEAVDFFKYRINSEYSYILIFEEKKKKRFIVYTSGKCKGIEIHIDKACPYILYQVDEKEMSVLSGYEIAYFHNTLSRTDYNSVNRCKYDFSIGKLIDQHYRTTTGMHYDDINKDKIRNYFDNEAFRIIEFLYKYAIRNELEIPFPIPKTIIVSIADQEYSEDYIINEAKKIKVQKDEASFIEKVYEFKNAIDNIVYIGKNKWVSNTIKNLILNCFKEIAIPHNSSSNTMKECIDFLKICRLLNNTEKIKKMKIFQLAKNVLDELCNRFDKNNDGICSKTKKYIEWLEKNVDKIDLLKNKAYLRLDIETGKEETFIKELIELYSDLNFAFPFYDFSFNVSTGEYYFLLIFSNIYSMINKERWLPNVYDYTAIDYNVNNILLIFDEADLSMHPRWQRMFMKWIIDFCSAIFNGNNVKIIITTHSPILLSDFPSNSVVYLTRNEDGEMSFVTDVEDTFGKNIHSLFLNSFFLEDEGTMGAFAEEKINQIIRMLKGADALDSEYDDECIENMINYIGEDTIHSRLEEIYHDKNYIREKPKAKIESSEQSVIKDTIHKLKQQQDYLQLIINSLEEGIQND